MNLHCLTTSKTNPQYCLFRQNFVNGEELDFSSKWETIKTFGWLKFWNVEGHELLAEKWHDINPDFTELIYTATNEEKGTWQELWEEHVTLNSATFWHIFTCAFENYQSRLNQSLKSEDSNLEYVEKTFEKLELENIEEKSFENLELENIEEVQKDTELSTDLYTDVDEEEQLRSFGLPTAFGTQRKRKSHQEDLHYNIIDFDSSAIMPHEDTFLHGTQKGKTTKKAKKKQSKKIRQNGNIPQFMQDENPLLKYWFKRFSLFSRFDQGILLDRESWFSVTPEKIAKQTARRLACDLIVDAFCGCGGNAIQFAFTCQKVIAIDIDPQKLSMAKHNAKIYNVDHKIEFIQADFLQFAKSTRLKPNMVFLSPPWGGPEYLKQSNFNIEMNLFPVGATELMHIARLLSPNIGFFLPRNANLKQVIALSGAAGQQCEVEHNFLDTRLVAITAYYGNDLVSAAVEEEGESS